MGAHWVAAVAATSDLAAITTSATAAAAASTIAHVEMKLIGENGLTIKHSNT